MSNEIAAMAESPQLTTRLLAEPAGHRTGSHPGSTAELPHRKGRTKEQDPCQGPCRPLPDELPFRHPFINSRISNACFLFTPAKIVN